MPNLIVISDLGGVRLLSNLKTYLNTLQLGLMVNNHTIAHGDAADASAFTEASFPGYARQTLNFGTAANNSNPPDSDITAATMTFTASAAPGSAQTIYGWFVCDPVDGKWIYGGNTNRSPAVQIVNSGDAYQIQVRFTDGTLTAYP